MNRRRILKMLGASSSLLLWGNPLLSLASPKPLSEPYINKKFVWVVLRGALDSLHTVVPTFDPNLSQLRPTLYQEPKNLLAIDKGFSLHPSLKNIHQWCQSKECSPIIAVSSGYSGRSHFDGQDYLESGLPRINFDSGWLARAVNLRHKKVLAIARSTPISLRSADDIHTWYPSHLKNSQEDLTLALKRLYQDDPALLAGLESGLEIRDMAGNITSKKNRASFSDLAKSCANLMTGEKGADCAMLELGGWDTHNNQVNRLTKKLAELDQGLAQLKIGLGAQWSNTVVIVATEFGRTAKENGTKGTDHGTASHLFIAGGGIKGGEVLGDWPGLSADELYQKRDLMPTSHSFSWFASLLQQHWGFSDAEVSHVFPEAKAYTRTLINA